MEIDVFDYSSAIMGLVNHLAIGPICEQIAADAQQIVPVDTGELRDSIHAIPAEGVVQAGTDHAVYVELGTRKMAAEPYLRPALYRQRNLRVVGS